MKHKYGEFSAKQIADIKVEIRKKIFFLLQIVDPNTKVEYSTEKINIQKAFDGLMYMISGMNSLLYEPKEIVTVLSLLEQARIAFDNKSEYTEKEFSESAYRKLILDAGSEVKKIKEV